MNIFFGAFLLIPVLIILTKEILKLKISLWWVFAVWIIVGWALVNLSVWRYSAQLEELFKATPNPSDEFLASYQNDGAANVFTWYFGWIYAAGYFVICLPLIHIVRYIQKTFVKN